MEIYYNQYCLIQYYEDPSLFYVKWFDNAKWYENDTDYQFHFENYVIQVEKYHPKNVLHDMIEATYTIPNNLQVWTNQFMFPRLRLAGLERVALLMSKHFLVNLSVELTMEENPSNLLFETQYFDSQEEALDWMVGQDFFLNSIKI